MQVKHAGATPPSSNVSQSSMGSSLNPPVLNLSAEGPPTPEDSSVREVFERNSQLSSTLQKESIDRMSRQVSFYLFEHRSGVADIKGSNIDSSTDEYFF